MNVGISTEAALFPEKEYIMDISFAVCHRHPPQMQLPMLLSVDATLCENYYIMF
jgi:hypothetical protein